MRKTILAAATIASMTATAPATVQADPLQAGCSRIEANVYFAPRETALGAPAQAVLRSFQDRVRLAHGQGLELSPVLVTGFSLTGDRERDGQGLAVERARRVQTELSAGAGLASVLGTPVTLNEMPMVGMSVLGRRVSLEVVACGQDRPALPRSPATVSI
jgi:hypothetical protein